MHGRPLTLVALTALSACASSAATPSAPSVPTAASKPALAPALSSFAFYVGSWQCKGHSFPVEEQKEEDWEARIEVVPELDGSWLSVQMIGPGMNRTIEHKGYDVNRKRWAHVSVLTEGYWDSMHSPGWTGQQIVFTPDDPKDNTTATFTKLSDTSYTHSVTRPGASGPEKLWEKSCTKV
jgi:hypothetical protein